MYDWEIRLVEQIMMNKEQQMFRSRTHAFAIIQCDCVKTQKNPTKQLKRCSRHKQQSYSVDTRCEFEFTASCALKFLVRASPSKVQNKASTNNTNGSGFKGIVQPFGPLP